MCAIVALLVHYHTFIDEYKLTRSLGKDLSTPFMCDLNQLLQRYTNSLWNGDAKFLLFQIDWRIV